MAKKLRYYESKKIENLRSALLASERMYSDRTAFLQKSGGAFRPTTYAEYLDMVEGLGTELYTRGYNGARIIVTGDNCLEWVTVYMATVCGLGVIVPVDKELPAEELANIVSASGASLIFYSPRLQAKIDTLGDGIDKFSFAEIDGLISEGRKKIEWGEKSYLQAPIDRDALAVLIFTSGTTGLAKGVMLSHKNICTNLTDTAAMAYSTCEDSYLAVLPFHHAYACTCSFLFPLVHGSSIAFCEGLRYITRNMQEIHPSVMCCVPILVETIYRKIWLNIRRKGIEKKTRTAIRLTGNNMALKRRVFSEIHDSLGGRLRMIICGGAPADPEVLKGLRDFGLLAIQGYGLTECAPLAAFNKDDFYRDTSAGLQIPGCVLDIYDIQSDGTGEVRVKGDNVMIGYLNAPEQTAEVIRDGWFFTGDLGFIDKDGFLHITGRKKNVIVTSGGKNIFPEELETYLCRNPFIAEAVVVGYINEKRGDYDIVAVLYPDATALADKYGKTYTQGQIDAELTEAMETVNGLVPSYKKIHYYVERKTEFDKNSSRKIRRQGVAEAAEEDYLKKLSRI